MSEISAAGILPPGKNMTPIEVVEFLRQQPMYRRMIASAVDTHATWKISEDGLLTVGIGTIKSVQEISQLFAERNIIVSYKLVGDDVRAEIRRRTHMLQPEITP